MNEQEYAITPEAVFEPQTEVYYAYGLEAAYKQRDQLQADTGKGWRIYARVD